MLPKLSITLFIFTVVFSGCQKDIDKQTNASFAANNSSTYAHGTVDSTGRWYGTFKDMFSDPDIFPDTVSEASLIYKGQASTADILPAGECLLSSVGYYMPADKMIAGDSITLTAMLTDDADIVQLDIMGKRNVAKAICIKNKGDSSTITLSVGNSITTSVVKPAIDFSAFREASLVMKKNKAVFLIGNISKTILVFKNADRIGMTKILSVGFNDQFQSFSPLNRNLKCSAIHLYNSYGHQPVMEETFSIKGKSHTVFY